ncbi:MAG: UvrD-helicase domain-containing protein, partial [Planctomycetes bacterium]|nr:UvrD-helicase domain-containing protein [Planctomycetota bacterium]
MTNINKHTQDQPLFEKEEARLSDILQTIDEYERARKAKQVSHHQELAELKKERLDSVNWQEKNRLTEKLRDKEAYDPKKYLPEFSHAHTPYFASFVIEDDDPRINHQEFLLGKQSLFKDSKVVIIDWRQAAVSALYYEYEAGDDYEEEINGKDRSGILTEKIKYTIKASELLRIEGSNGEIYEKGSGGWGEADGVRSTSTEKQDSADHHLVDIVSLISPDQFRMITRDYHGCLRLQGSAGAGKTTIALHRLSYLIFNYPEKFRVERCLVLMFNRALRDYVSVTVEEMLGKDAQVETFHTWALRSLRSLGLRKIALATIAAPSEFDPVKKSSGMAEVVQEYAQSAQDAVAAEHLLRIYSSEALLSKHVAAEVRPTLIKKFAGYYRQRLADFDNSHEIAFSDVGILLRLFQLRTLQKDPDAENFALNYFDHLVIDEAQDFSQVELECLFAASSKERSLTICADPNQQILSFVDASGLTNFEVQLRKSGV